MAAIRVEARLSENTLAFGINSKAELRKIQKLDSCFRRNDRVVKNRMGESVQYASLLHPTYAGYEREFKTGRVQ